MTRKGCAQDVFIDELTHAKRERTATQGNHTRLRFSRAWAHKTAIVALEHAMARDLHGLRVRVAQGQTATRNA